MIFVHNVVRKFGTLLWRSCPLCLYTAFKHNATLYGKMLLL